MAKAAPGVGIEAFDRAVPSGEGVFPGAVSGCIAAHRGGNFEAVGGTGGEAG